MKQFFKVKYSWESVYYHYHKWSMDGSWEKVWNMVIYKYANRLDLSCIQIDGTHTPAKRGGESTGYQGRKKSKTTNMLLLADSQGIPLAVSPPMAGNHNDAYKLKENFNNMLQMLEKSSVSTQGLFLNADAGFDTQEFRKFCNSREIIANIAQNSRKSKNKEEKYIFDQLLYKYRFVIERTNAWLDAFKAILIRFETKNETWKSLWLLAFTVILLRKL
jgi:transposase